MIISLEIVYYIETEIHERLCIIVNFLNWSNKNMIKKNSKSYHNIIKSKIRNYTLYVSHTNYIIFSKYLIT